MVNQSWLSSIRYSTLELLAPRIPDYSSSLISFSENVSFVPKPLKFFNFWCDRPDLSSWILEDWSSEVEVHGSPMF